MHFLIKDLWKEVSERKADVNNEEHCYHKIKVILLF